MRDKEGFRVVDKVFIATKDPEEQPRLDTEYRKFRIQFAGTRNATRRDFRRDQIKKELKHRDAK